MAWDARPLSSSGALACPLPGRGPPWHASQQPAVDQFEMPLPQRLIAKVPDLPSGAERKILGQSP